MDSSIMPEKEKLCLNIDNNNTINENNILEEE